MLPPPGTAPTPALPPRACGASRLPPRHARPFLRRRELPAPPPVPPPPQPARVVPALGAARPGPASFAAWREVRDLPPRSSPSASGWGAASAWARARVILRVARGAAAVSSGSPASASSAGWSRAWICARVRRCPARACRALGFRAAASPSSLPPPSASSCGGAPGAAWAGAGSLEAGAFFAARPRPWPRSFGASSASGSAASTASGSCSASVCATFSASPQPERRDRRSFLSHGAPVYRVCRGSLASPLARVTRV